jgi:hypothetical protein
LIEEAERSGEGFPLIRRQAEAGQQHGHRHHYSISRQTIGIENMVNNKVRAGLATITILVQYLPTPSAL